MLALTGVKLYSPNLSLLLQMTLWILPTMSLAAEKNVHGYVLTLVLLVNNECAIDTMQNRVK